MSDFRGTLRRVDEATLIYLIQFSTYDPHEFAHAGAKAICV